MNMIQGTYDQLKSDEIWNRFLQGDRAAFEQIFDLHAQSLLYYGRKITEDTCLVEDCMQDLFLELWHRRERLGQVNSVRHYLLKSLKRRILYKKKRLVSFRNEYKEENFEVSYETQLIQIQTSQEQRQKLEAALSHLTKQQKKVMYLKYYEKLSYQEIAAMLSLNKRTIYNIVSASIRELQKTFKNSYHEVTIIITSLIFSFLL
jgi:RNA polymerase sigma factor (sigma-70 family)